MEKVDDFLNNVKTGEWSEETVQKYFELSDEENFEDCSEAPLIRNYRESDSKVERLVARTGSDGLDDFLDAGCQIKIIERNGDTAGVIVYKNSDSETYIGAVAVDETMEGQGIMGDLINSIYDGNTMVAKVNKANDRARSAFEKYGFHAEKIRNDWMWMTRD